MKAEKMIVGSLAVVMALVASGCGTTMSDRGGFGPGVAFAAPVSAGSTPPEAPTPLVDRPNHHGNRVSHMSFRAPVTKSR